MRFENRAAIITGAASGMGLVASQELAKEGAAVYMVDINEQRVTAEAEAICAQGGKAEDIAQYLSKGNGGVVNSSRGILLAYKKQPGVAFDEAAYNECVNMKEAIAHACSLL